MSDDLHRWMSTQAERLRTAIDARLPPADQHPARLHEAMRYSASVGGKFFRPLLMFATAEALGLEPEQLDGAAVAVELIHTYSLIHDDLPAMDDDDLRRGRPTCHRQFDEATAILAGDALQALAFQLLAEDPQLPAAPAARLRIVATVATAIGSRGMAGGQAVDLESEGQALGAAELESMHIHKTGALIRASVLCACLCRDDLEPAVADALDHYAKCVGLAFQIHDDVLDEIGTTEEMGKDSGSDRARNKSTYPALFGVAESQRMADNLIDDALSRLDALKMPAPRLRELARFVIERRQ